MKAPVVAVRRRPILAGPVLWMVGGALLAWLLGVAAVVAAVIIIGPGYWRQQAPPVSLPPPIPVLLTVDAAQDGFADSAVEQLFLRVLVDGELLESFILRFDGATPLERSRALQTFELGTVPSGSRRITILASSEAAMWSSVDRVEQTLKVRPRLSLVIREKLDGGRELRIR